MKKLYKFEVITTDKYFIEVEANDREKADELMRESLDEVTKESQYPFGVSHQSLDSEISLISAEDLDEDEPDDEDLEKLSEKLSDEPSDEDCVQEGEKVEEDTNNQE